MSENLKRRQETRISGNRGEEMPKERLLCAGGGWFRGTSEKKKLLFLIFSITSTNIIEYL